MKRNAARRLAVVLSISIVFQSVGGSVFSGDSGWFSQPGMVSEAQERPIPGDTTAAVTATPGNAQTEDKEPDTDTASPSDAVVKVYGFSGEEEWLTVALGTGKAEIPFPESVIAIVSEDEEEVIEGITWINRGSYDPDTAGVYEFELRLPKGYRLMSGVRLPVLYVCTGDHLITGLEFAEEAEKELHVMQGTKESKLELPETLIATVCGTNEMVIPVTWKCEGGYNPEKAGTYLFAAVPGKEYQVAAGVDIPEAAVVVTGAVLYNKATTVEPKIDVVVSSRIMWRNDIAVTVTLTTDQAVALTGTVGLITVSITNQNGEELIKGNNVPIKLKEKTPVVFQDPRSVKPTGNDEMYYVNVSFQPASESPIREKSWKKEKTFTVYKASLELADSKNFAANGTYEESLGNIEFTNGQVFVKNTELSVSGHWEWYYDEAVLNTTFPTAVGTESYKAKFMLDKAEPNQEYYEPFETSLKPKIKPRQLWFVDRPELDTKYYSGTAEGKVKSFQVRKTESAPPEELRPGDYEEPTVKYDDYNAGTGKKAVVSVTLKNKNYCFDSKGSLTASQTVENLTIKPNQEKPDIDADRKVYSIYSGNRTVPETIVLSNTGTAASPNALFTLKVPSTMKGTLGTVTTAIKGSPSNVVTRKGENADRRELVIENVCNAVVGTSDELKITFHSTNFQPVTATLQFEAIEQKTPYIEAKYPTVKGAIRSRQKIGDSTLSLTGTVKDPNNTGITISGGSWSWVNPDATYKAGKNNLEWRYTPPASSGNEYTEKTGFVEVTVQQSDATFDPAYSDSIRTEKDVYPYGTALNDMKLVDGNGSTDRWTWKFTNTVKPNTVPKKGSTVYTAEYLPSDPVDFKSAEKKITVNIEKSAAVLAGGPPEVSGVYGGKITDYKFTPDTGTVTSDGIPLEGTWVWDTDNLDINSIPDVGGTKAYPAKFNIRSNADYYTEVKANIIPNVSPRNLQDITKATLKQKVYDGTPTGAVDTVTCRSSDKKTVTLNPSDYTYRVVYDNHNAGKNRSAMVYIRSNTPNYTIMREEGEMFFEVRGAVIEKSTVIPEVFPGTLTCYANMEETKTVKTTFDLNQFVPVAKPGETTGTVTYSLSPVSTTVGKYTVDKKGILTITAQKWDGSDPEDKVRVYVDTENYQQATVDLYVKGTRKQVPAITEPMTYSSRIGAGQPLSRLKLNESVVFLDKEGNPVSGAVQWKEPGKVFEPGIYSAEWIFIPEDQEKYVSVAGTLTFTVEESNFTVIVNNGTGGGSYAEGAIVEIRANIPADHAFLGWTGSPGVNFTDTSKAATTFVMPARDVTVTGNSEYRPSFAVTVINGEGAGTYFVGETVSITAKAPSSRDKFRSWTSPQGVVFKDAYSAETTFTMPEMAVTVTADFNGSGSGGGGGGGGGGGSSGVGKTPANYVTNGVSPGQWCNDIHGWWFRNIDGTYAVNEWRCILASDNKPHWYFFDQNGYMVSGWLAKGAYTYYFELASGVSFGAMTIGWKMIDGKWYYFDPAGGASHGAMLRNITTADGYRLGEDGSWIP